LKKIKIVLYGAKKLRLLSLKIITPILKLHIGANKYFKSPIPNPQIPNPQSPIPNPQKY